MTKTRDEVVAILASQSYGRSPIIHYSQHEKWARDDVDALIEAGVIPQEVSDEKTTCTAP